MGWEQGQEWEQGHALGAGTRAGSRDNALCAGSMGLTFLRLFLEV